MQMAVSTTTDRIDWIDYAKGFILIGVCLDHADFPCYISTFHMAAFFFISGLLFNPEKEPSLIKYVQKKWKSLLKPYSILSFFFLLLYPPLYDPSVNYVPPGIIYNFLDSFKSDYLRGVMVKISIFTIDIFMGESSPDTIPLWFVYTLFQISCVFAIIYYTCKKFTFYATAIPIICIMCFVLGWYLSKFNIKIPFKMETMITSLSFYGMGFISRSFLLNKIKKCSIKNLSMVWLLFFICFFIGFKLIDEGCIGYVHNSLGNSFVGYLLASVFGTLSCVLCFYIISRFKIGIMAIILKQVANNGMTILAVHFFVISCCNYFIKDKLPEWQYQCLLLFLMVIIVGVSIPIFNKHLYWMIGKSKKI